MGWAERADEDVHSRHRDTTNGRRDAGPFLRDARADATLERAERSTERDNLGDTIDALLEAELQV